MRGLLLSALFILMIISLWVPTYGQSTIPLAFERIGKETGLSHNSIRHIVQDAQGFIWIGTEDGLNRFDGREMVVFRNILDNPQSLSSNFIEHLSVDNEGNLWIATVRGLNKLNTNSGLVQQYLAKEDDPEALAFNHIFVTLPVADGFIWVGGAQLSRLNHQTERFQSWVISKEGEGEELVIENIAAINQRELLLGTNSGLFHFDIDQEIFTYIDLPKSNPQASPRVIGLGQDTKDQIWVSTLNGVFQLDKNLSVVNHLKADPQDSSSISDHDIPAIIKDGNGGVWMGSFSHGLNYLNPQTGNFQHFRYDPDNPQSLSDNIIWSLLKDQQGNLWVGTNNGLNRAEPDLDLMDNSLQRPNFSLTKSLTKSNNPTSGSAIRTLLEDQEGFLWVGTDGAGLIRVNQQTGQRIHIRHNQNNQKSLPSDRVRIMIEDEQQTLWVGSFGGISYLTTEQRRQYAHQLDQAPWQHVMPPHPYSGDPFIIQTRALCMSKDGMLWIGSSYEGLFQWNPKTNEFTNFTHNSSDSTTISSNEVLTIFEDSAGQIWVGTFGGGLNCLNRETGTFKRFQYSLDNPSSISDDFVWALHEDQQRQLWVGTQGGLNCLTPDAPNSFRRVQEKDGLPNNVIYGILEDQQGRLWLSTNKGLAAYEISTGRCFTYDTRDGLQADEFNPNAYCSTQSGKFIFGGVSGYNTFQPAAFQLDSYNPAVQITALTRYREADEQSEKLKQHFITNDQEITFTHQDNLIIFGVSMLNFRQPHKNSYQYRLLGLQNSWFPLEDENQITFTNLPAGNYTLQIRGANHHGIWQMTPTELPIRVKPPWWWSKLAIFFYTLAFISLIIFFYRYQLNRQLAEREAYELRKLDALKTRFFTNISHEFRTPLTMILGPAKRSLKALSKNKVAEAISDHKLILQNGQRLLKLVNEILDINKLEAGKLAPNYVQTDIVRLLKEHFNSFKSLAEGAAIQLQFKANLAELNMDVDPDMTEKIVSNLLSNAIKYTPTGGTVCLDVLEANGLLQLQVTDTGVGIPADQLPFIFNRFYQVNGTKESNSLGTGVGLSLTKELVELLGGRIEVASELEKGTNFTVSLPIHQHATQTTIDSIEISDSSLHLEQVLPTHSTTAAPPIRTEETQILIVEDNADMADYIASCLSNNYLIDFALNGRLGLDKAIQQIPDLIITDVMMPEMDGFEFCQHIKTDERTNHIPVIILTARAGIEQKITGLRTGADAYLSKPFNEEELQVRVEQLLLTREQLRTRWQDSLQGEVNKSEPDDQPMDESFVNKIQGIIIQNLQATNFEVEDLAREVGMSESQLRRKLSALTGLPPIRFIRSIRIQRAQELLLNTKLGIAEVAYETGFSDPKYFSRIFSRSTGNSPSDFRKSKKNSS